MSLSKANNLVRSVTVDLYRGLSRRLTDLVSQYVPGFTTEKALVSVAVVLIMKKVIQIAATQRRYHELLERAKRKRRERDHQILREFIPNIDIPEDISTLVLNSTVSELIQLLNQDKVTSEEILRIYHNRAITIGARLELIAESNFTEALELAKQCDETRRNTPKESREQLGHLFGVPIAIKDSIRQKGLDATCGLARNCFNPCTEDSPIVKALKAQGAIPFIRSNVCQALAAYDSANNIWGRALNPWDIERTPGGSSGGDAGLVAAKCAPIGYGTDFYGSIRIPAGFTGTYGLRATSGRLSVSSGMLVSPHDPARMSFMRATSGPIGRCVEDLVLVTKSVITPENKNTDPLYPFIPWNEEKFNVKGKLRIGYILSTDFFGTSKPCKRAVEEAVAALKRAGHEVIDIRIPNFDAMILHIFRFLTLEGTSRHLSALEGEKPVSEISHLIRIGLPSNFTKRILRLFLGKRLKSVIDQTLKASSNELVLALSRLCTFRDQFLRYWTDWKLDAIVAPVCALPAFKLEHGTKLLFAGCYTWIGNLANTPAGVVPITKVQPGEDVYTSEDTIYDDDLLFKYSQECMNGTVGLPVGVQVMTLPYEEEKCLGIMKILQDEVKFYELPTVN